jgi:hypothetical protein
MMAKGPILGIPTYHSPVRQRQVEAEKRDLLGSKQKEAK